MSSEIDSLIETVQQNCHISDARFAQNYTLCIYLLKMRELYRWEQGHGYEEKLAHEALGGWITEREALWDRVENDAFSDLSFASQLFSPFESDMLNNKLFPHGYVYSGGYGRFAKPLFVVAELESQQQHQAMNIVITGRELARDIVAPPAMTQGKTIIVRRESLQRMLWERIEESGSRYFCGSLFWASKPKQAANT
ncbi:Sfum_1244 family protein [Candidatus Reidiella endopervernicosa]|uniref:DUF6866 domain-containing protein n=1 Tax=Candidatus Reidiella endopervernicosa TaxID=2738883 RepID=A0A6N0HWR4_9GAMM|nr:Sfum_1244 family protein [Candidatus Reidiella endopervernicosa]QKQ26772.1 hypothetical protein HUE57_11105 [Candidatus Reidiella endopervernicosa]